MINDQRQRYEADRQTLKRRLVMGDTGKKDKNKKQEQKANKQNQEAKRKQEQRQKKPM